MSDFDPALQDEQVVLAILLAEPQSHTWELSGIEESLFRSSVNRQIASALIYVRDSGARLHWHRVSRVLKERKQPFAAALVVPLVRSLGTSSGLTCYVSRLHYNRARRAERSA